MVEPPIQEAKDDNEGDIALEKPNIAPRRLGTASTVKCKPLILGSVAIVTLSCITSASAATL